MSNNPVVWQKTIAYGDRHCWVAPGREKRIMPSGNPADPAECNQDHTDDPSVVGVVPWLRFIRTFGKMCDDSAYAFATNPFVGATDDNDTKRLILNGYHRYVVTDPYGYQHFYDYCEEYWIRAKNDTWRMTFAVYLDNDSNIAHIRCFVPEWEAICERAYLSVLKDMAADASIGLAVSTT